VQAMMLSDKEMLCGAYIRVSTEEQARKGLSLENQEATIKEYISRNGWKLVDMYIDRGITARKKLQRRTEFLRMMGDVQKKRINHIVVLRLDRFFRNVYDYHWMMKTYLDPAGCGWSAALEEYDTTTTNGRLMINLRLSIAEQEADTDSDRIKDVFANRIREGYAVTGKQAFGYKVAEDKRVVVVPEQAAIVKDAFNHLIECGSGRATHRYITDTYGLHFSPKTFYRMLRKPIYIGVYRDNTHFCEPIISKKVFDEAVRIMAHNSRTYSKKGNPPNVYMFSGLLVCGVCGGNYNGCTNSASTRSYRCSHHFVNMTCPNNKTIAESIIKRYLLTEVAEVWKQHNAVTVADKKQKAPPKSNRKQVEAKLRRLTDLYVDGKISKSDYTARYDTLLKSIVEEKPVTPLKTEARRAEALLRMNLPDLYERLSADEIVRLWREIIKRIVIGKDGIESVEFIDE